MGKVACREQAVRGPLAVYASGYRAELLGRGYSLHAVRLRLWQLDHLSRWLEAEGVVPGGLAPARVDEFLEARRARGYRSWVSPRSMVLPLGYLRAVGAVPTPAPVAARGPVEELLGEYCRYLACERGLAQGTIGDYERVARLFLSERSWADGAGVERLTSAQVTAFVARECPRRSVASACYLACGLRSLLRYLHVAGITSVSLVGAVPGIPVRRAKLPRALEPAVVARLLASCDRRRTVGRRDHAILLLLARLGLRAGEVAALQLDDVDWRAGEILIRGKGDRHERLPLPHDVGEALVSYLRRRPPQESRVLFVRVNAPRGALRARAVCAVVHDACVRAGVPPVGAHRLRHTAATGMLRAGASLPEIAEVLRHRRLETTTIYARVDRAALRELALPWPGGAA
jgi:site-specific recombinase XerD